MVGHDAAVAGQADGFENRLNARVQLKRIAHEHVSVESGCAGRACRHFILPLPSTFAHGEML
ncbi:MAG TPA: hypothetical protein PKA37_02295 [Planctomycetota bacterium]|nr:hypothetical protein [Planctomycetota bacterium]